MDVPVPHHYEGSPIYEHHDPLGSSSKPRGSLACLTCRRQKLRCDYAEKAESSSEPICSRCLRLGKECTAVSGARGRKPGSKNKPKGLKAEELESDDVNVSPKERSHRSRNSLSMDFAINTPSFINGPSSPPEGDVTVSMTEPPEPQNPLGLLAEASHTAQTPATGVIELGERSMRKADLIIGPSTPQLGLKLSQQVLQDGLQMILEKDSLARSRPPSRNEYFASRPQGEGKRDVGPHLDPIDLHLLEPEDADLLFASFFRHENACAPILDVDLHTPAYCRARSALLYSAICLVAAQTLPGEASITYRLRQHIQFLRKEIYIKNHRSLEILQGFDVLALWPILSEHMDEDRSNLFLAHAIAIAYELGLDRDGRHIATPGDLSRQEQREKRARERALISLYIWDRTFSAATGSTWMLPDSFLPAAVKHWDKHTLAAVGDAALLQHALMRQETSAIQLTLRRELMKGGETSHIPKLLFDLYHDRLGRWLFDFQQKCRAGVIPRDQEVNIRMLYHTSCVWILASGLPYTTKDEASQSLVAALQNAALEACENCVLDAEIFNHAPFNFAVLVLYAALISLKLHQAHGDPQAFAPLLGLLAQVAHWLEVSGSAPAHRMGNNTLYGQHLMQVLQAAAARSSSYFPPTLAPTPQAHQMNGWSNAPTPRPSGEQDAFLTLDWLSSALPPSAVADMISSTDWISLIGDVR